MATWSKSELRGELSCDKDTLDVFLAGIGETPDSGKRYSETQTRRICTRWYSTGAAAQYDAEGRITSNEPVSLKDHRESVEYARTRVAVLQRDHWRCSICSSTDLPVEMDHRDYGSIRAGRQGTEDEVKSCRILCVSCHRKLHKSRN